MELYISYFNYVPWRAVRTYDFDNAPRVTLIYSLPGLGKSKMLKFLKARHTALGSEVLFLNAKTFSQAYAYSAQENSLPAFRRYLRGAKLLLFDDIHILRDKIGSIEEFFYTYEHVTATGGKLVITLESDCPKLDFLGQRLASRLHSGSIYEIKPPDMEELQGYIEFYIRKRKITVEDAVIPVLAGLVHNLQEAEDKVDRFVRFAEVRASALDMECFHHFQESLLCEERHKASPPNIIEAVSQVMGLDPKAILGNRRTKDVVLARQMAIYLTRELSRLSFPEIGRWFGREHSAIIRACNEFQRKLSSHDELVQICKEIKAFFVQ